MTQWGGTKKKSSSYRVEILDQRGVAAAQFCMNGHDATSTLFWETSMIQLSQRSRMRFRGYCGGVHAKDGLAPRVNLVITRLGKIFRCSEPKLFFETFFLKPMNILLEPHRDTLTNTTRCDDLFVVFEGPK